MILSLEVARVTMPLCNGKVYVLDEQARLAKYITTRDAEAPSLSVEDVMGAEQNAIQVGKTLGCFVGCFVSTGMCL